MTINRQDIERVAKAIHDASYEPDFMQMGFWNWRSDGIKKRWYMKAEKAIEAMGYAHLDNALQECLGVLEEIYGCVQNEMVANNLPLEWRKDTAMGKAQSILDKFEGLRK